MKNNKVDKGFEIIYWKLSYRRKFIRTLWMTAVCVVLMIFVWITGDRTIINRVMPIASIILCCIQLLYTYIKWKKEE
jgi:amino acid permease